MEKKDPIKESFKDPLGGTERQIPDRFAGGLSKYLESLNNPPRIFHEVRISCDAIPPPLPDGRSREILTDCGPHCLTFSTKIGIWLDYFISAQAPLRSIDSN